MKETIFSILKMLMIASGVGLIIYIVYTLKNPHDENKSSETNPNNDNVHKMRKTG